MSRHLVSEALHGAPNSTMVMDRFQTLSLEALPGAPIDIADDASEHERRGQRIQADNIRLN